VAKKVAKKASKKHSSSSDHLTDDDSFEKSLHFRQNEPIPDDAPPEIKLIRTFLYHMDAHNIEGMQKLTDQRCYFYFVGIEMPASEFYESVKDTFASFPDLHFFWKLMTIWGLDPTTGGTIVMVKDYYGIGKHVGKPYAFGPYEPIPATGKIVRDENIEVTFVVKNGKIITSKIDACGKLVGPPGFYTKIGGIII